jgi:transposase
MYDFNVIAIDLSKTVFQICLVNRKAEIVFNKEMTKKQLLKFLVTQKQSVVAMEACGSAQHWARKAQEFGHIAMVLPTKPVAANRQGQKTDANDALAIAVTARQPGIKVAGLKTLEQQSLQSDKRVEEHLSDQLTATGNMLRGLIAEFGVTIVKGKAALKRDLPFILEDAENGLPIAMRESLESGWTLWQTQEALLLKSEAILKKRCKEHEACKRLEKLEGVGIKNAVGLYVAIGDGRQFKNGREASACIAVTPKQHSTGGNVYMMGIGKFRGNQKLRSSLIVGARAKVYSLAKREAKTEKERWLKSLIERRGEKRAAVALANKTVRTAWAMLHNNEPYRPSNTIEL